MSTERKYVVDRIEGELVVLLEDESGEKVNLDSWELPAIDEGTVLAVELDNNGKPKWGTATVLAEETKRRSEQGRNQIDELKKRDPGGDITL
jgi:hypothetical protein